MAAVTAAAVSLPSSSAKPSPSPALTSHCFLSYPRRRTTPRNARGLNLRAQVSTTDAAVAVPAKKEKISKKQDEGVVTNKYRPKEPYVGKCLLNTKITAADAPGETWHMVFSTEGNNHFLVSNSLTACY